MRIMLGTPPLEFNTYNTTGQTAGHAHVNLHPPRGIIIGGGAEVNFDPGAGNMLTALYPDTQTNTWVARSKDHGISSPASVHAWCITAMVSPDDVYVARAANANHTGMTEARAILPKEYELVSGGARAYLEDQPDAGALLVTSFPWLSDRGVHEGWIAAATDHIVTSPVAVEAYAVGLSKAVIARHRLRVLGDTKTGAGPTAHPSAEVTLRPEIERVDGRGVVTGGGGIPVPAAVSNFLFQSFPLADPDKPDAWRVWSKDHDGVNAPTQRMVTAFAIIALP
jgi:hypothetical protein